MKKKLELYMTLVLLCAAGILGRQGAKLVSATREARESGRYQVVIDVGHGGIDSGKVSADGI